MAIASTLFGIAVFILGLLLTVGLHELGHFLPAKKFGVLVPRYFIGFGPTLWSIRRNGTEYGIKAIPLGGFVQLAGMLPPARPGARVKKKHSGELTLAETARQESAAELPSGQEHQAFWRLPAWKKLVVMFGGPFVNLMLAVGLTIAVMCGIGWGTYSTRIATVQACVNGETVCAEADMTPAAAAGLLPGDEILTWGSHTVHTWEDIYKAIANGGTDTVRVLVERAKSEHSSVQEYPATSTENSAAASVERLTLSITPIREQRPMVRDGAVVTDPETGEQRLEEKPYVGISPQIQLQRQSLTAALAQTGTLAAGTVKVVAALPMKLWDTATQLITGEPRGADSVMSVVGVADMAGTIASADIEGYGFAERAADFLMLMAALNMSLFIFNLLPLLPLDGGHILGALIEGARRLMWRAHGGEKSGKPQPGAFDTARLLPLSYVVIAFFLVMTVVLVAADLINPVV